MRKSCQGILLADKGLIRPFLKEALANQGIDLQTPLKKNIDDTRPQWFVQKIVSVRRLVETVIGQLVDRFHIQAIKAKDVWHLGAKIGRKLLSHTVAFCLNLSENPKTPLQFDNLISS